jgi:hypothetical protein
VGTVISGAVINGNGNVVAPASCWVDLLCKGGNGVAISGGPFAQTGGIGGSCYKRTFVKKGEIIVVATGGDGGGDEENGFYDGGNSSFTLPNGQQVIAGGGISGGGGGAATGGDINRVGGGGGYSNNPPQNFPAAFTDIFSFLPTYQTLMIFGKQVT